MTNTHCCVPNCHSSSGRHFLLKFYRLPKNKKQRKRWTNLIRYNPTSAWKSICSLHFLGGRKTYDIRCPTIFPWSAEWHGIVESHNTKIQSWFESQQQVDHCYSLRPASLKLDTSSTRKCAKPRQTRNSSGMIQRNPSSLSPVDLNSEIPPDNLIELQDPSYGMHDMASSGMSEDVDEVHSNKDCGSRRVNKASDSSDINRTTSIGVEGKNEITISKPYYESTFIMTKDELQDLLGHIERWLERDDADIDKAKQLLRTVVKLLRNYKEQYETLVTLREMDRFLLKRFEGSDDDIRFWTGFYSYDAFKIFWSHHVEPNSCCVRYWGAHNAESRSNTKCGPKRKLAAVDELFMVLVKLKRGSATKDLGERFRLSESHVSRIFVTWIKVLNTLLSAVDIWLSRNKVRKHMPHCFKPLYKAVRVVVDCTEIRSERPSDLEVQCATYSSYKSCNTYKALIGISPSGIPTFISPLYEDSISDNEITNQTKLRDLLKPGDAMMADRGWTCANWLTKKGVRLVTPHFLHGKKSDEYPRTRGKCLHCKSPHPCREMHGTYKAVAISEERHSTHFLEHDF